VLLWIILATLTAVVLLVLLRPLVTRSREDAGRAEFDAAVYRDQLREVESDRERGLIGPVEAEAAKLEISRRLLASADEKQGSGAPAPLRFRSAAMLAVSILIPLAAVSLYLVYGSPGTPDQPLAARLTDPANEQDVAVIIARVEARLRAHPDEGEGWDAVAPVYMGTGRYVDAADAYTKAIKLLGETPKRLAGRGQALVLASNGVVSEDARKSLERAVALDGSLLEPRILLAIAKEQDGRFQEAIDDWRALLDRADPSAPWRNMVEQRMAAAQAHLTGDVQGLANAPAKTGPSEQDMTAAQKMNPADRQAMIEQMVQRLAQRLEQQGDDLAGWLQLVKAYSVLDRKNEAEKALSRAKTQFSGRTDAIEQLDALAAELGLKS
jgi:cytochrome c-type biogenesis protein CcmH